MNKVKTVGYFIGYIAIGITCWIAMDVTLKKYVEFYGNDL
jgi:hypothetical protein